MDSKTGQLYKFEPVEDTTIVKKTENGYTLIYLTVDEAPESPDSWRDNALFLVHYHRNFWIENSLCSKGVLGYIYTHNEAFDKEGAKALQRDYYVFPVSAYIHSGIVLSLSNCFALDAVGWDTSHVGAVLVKKTIDDGDGCQYKCTEKDAERMAEGLVVDWNLYLSGEVFCLVCEKLDENKKMIDFDITHGFYGLDYAKEELKTEI
jgi:hypothetical protein